MAVIGNLVANLVADTSAFTAPMVQAQGTIQDVGRSIQRSGSIASGVFSGLAKFAGVAMVFRGVTSSISGMVAGAVDAQKSGAKLDAVLASTGGAAGVSGDEIRKLAGDLQLVTDFEDDATIAAAGVLATFTQVRGDVFKDAIVSAQNLSAVMGQDLQSSVVQIGKALNDPIKGITALSRVGVSFTQQQKDQITQMTKAGDIAGAQALILRELQTEFGGAAEAMSSPFTRIGNIVGDVGEGIGAVFLPALEAVASRIAEGILPVAESMSEKFATAGGVLRDVVVSAINTAVTVVSNFGTYLDLLGAQTALVFVQIGNAVSYFFTDQLPAYFTWFIDNWGNLWTDALSITQTAFSNLFTNVGTNMAAIWEYIASGGTTALEFAWTPLLDGFEATVSELPKIAERIPSELEKTLGESVATLQGKLEADMATTMEGLQRETEKKPITPKIETASPESLAVAKKDKAAGAVQMGTKEALSSIFGSMRQDDIQRQLLALQQQGVQIQQQQLDALEGMASDEGEGID